MVCALSGLHLETDANNVVLLQDSRVIATVLLEYWVQSYGPTSPLDGRMLNEHEIAQLLCYSSDLTHMMAVIDESRKSKSSACIHPKAMAFQRQIFYRHAMSKFLEEVIRKDNSLEMTELKLRILFAAYLREFPTQFLNDLTQMYKTLVDLDKNSDILADRPGFYEGIILKSHCRTIMHNYLSEPLHKVLELFEEPIHFMNHDLQAVVHSMFNQSWAENLEQTLAELENALSTSSAQDLLQPGTILVTMNPS